MYVCDRFVLWFEHKSADGTEEAGGDVDVWWVLCRLELTAFVSLYSGYMSD